MNNEINDIKPFDYNKFGFRSFSMQVVLLYTVLYSSNFVLFLFDFYT